MQMEYYGATAAAQKKVNDLLGLDATGKEQDWEIEFAESRLIEPALRLLESDGLVGDEKAALCLLLLASIDSQIEDKGEASTWAERVAVQLAKDPTLWAQMKFYWIELKRSLHIEEMRRMLKA